MKIIWEVFEENLLLNYFPELGSKKFLTDKTYSSEQIYGDIPDGTFVALKYIYEVRNAAANGHETLDTDASAEAAKTGDLACEHYLLSKGKLQVEVMTNLDKVAPAGALLFVAWPNIKGATRLPARLVAITPKI